VARLTGQVNQMLHSREAYRMASLPVDGALAPMLVSTLRAYDELIEQFIGNSSMRSIV
jgi:hypothetical protein